MNSSQRLRSRIILALIFIGAIFLISALYWIQIINGDTYVAKANQQYSKPNSKTINRGTIYFMSKDGTKVAAATLGSGYTVYMNPSQVKDPVQAFEALSDYIKVEKTNFLERAAKVNDRYEVLGQMVDTEVGKSVRSLQIPGIGVIPENWRFYPGGTLASHALGLLGEDSKSDMPTGKYGLERVYESVLRRSGSNNSASIFAQSFSKASNDQSDADGDIVTTIEPTVQKYLEKVLKQTETTWHSDEIGGIIMDPKTGEIVAMASLPDFDPNNTAAVKKVSIFSNPLVEHVYEMGSILKPLTMAVALDKGVVKPTSTYEDTGTMVLNGKKISNYDGRARGVIGMQEILSQSLNVGVAHLALKVGKDDFAKYFFSFGLGEKTGIDEPNEATGIVGNLKSGKDIEIATAAYGQGIAISPVNVTRALSVLGNGGYMVTPHLVRSIEFTDGTSKKISYPKKGPMLKKETVEDVTKMLINVVDDKIAVAHPDIHWQNYSIAAKTGTAQIADPATKSYYPDKYLHSFFGYFPAYDAKFIVFLYQIYPKGAQYASETLTTPFSEITQFLIDYYNVSPDR